jgi:hypothetical protein
MRRLLSPALLACFLTLQAQAAPRPATSRVGGYLGAYLDARARGDDREAKRQLRNGRARWAPSLNKADGELLKVQLHLAHPDALRDEDLALFGGRVAVRGTDLVDVWLPVARIGDFVTAHPEVEFAQLPWRPVSLMGPHESQGATRFRPADVQCLGDDGGQTAVAVVDEDFQDIDKSVKAGELSGYQTGNKLGMTGSHGAMCAETVADVAPTAPLVLYSVSSVATMQAFAKEVTSKGNPKHIGVVSHSVGWFGQSFGRHTGPLCAVTDQVRSANIVWVNAAGNNGGGSFYEGIWTDADKDGSHDLQPGEKRLQFHAHSWGQIQLVIDWDDYEARKIDLNATLWRKDGANWVVETTSGLKQGKNVPSAEWLVVQTPQEADYGIEITAKAPIPPGLRLRVVSTGYGLTPFSIWTDNGNVYDPASCKGVLAVGAMHWSDYDKGPLEDFSSFGPTVDGRQKPEVVAPDGTSTSFGDFYGTSAACPHVAGLAALLRTAMPDASADAIVQTIIAGAKPMGDGGWPDDAYGFGRVEMTGVELGWECTNSVALGSETTCVTACGSIGKHTCGGACRWNTCEVPSENCNGKDDDCNGATDESFTCSLGATATCTTDSGEAGTHTCSSICAWNTCQATADATNGVDGMSAADTGSIDSGANGSDSGCAAGKGSGSGWTFAMLCATAFVGIRRRFAS